MRYLPHCCDKKEGGRVLLYSYNLRYEVYLFFNILDSAPLSSPSPSPSPTPSSLRKHKDLVRIFTIICNLVRETSSLKDEFIMTRVISTALIQRSDKPALPLKILRNMLDRVKNHGSQYLICKKFLALAANRKVTGHVDFFKKIDVITMGSNTVFGKLFLLISNILKENESSAMVSFNFLLKYLATFFAEDAHNMEEAKKEAVKAILEVIRLPNIFEGPHWGKDYQDRNSSRQCCFGASLESF